MERFERTSAETIGSAAGSAAPAGTAGGPAGSALAAGRDLVLPVDGLHGAGCVRRLEAALSAVPGIADVTVSLPALSVRMTPVAGDATPATGPLLAAAAATIRGAGFQVPAEEVVLDIDGMTCGGCVRRVERALAGVPGVVAAGVDLTRRRARIDTLDAAGARAALADAVTRAGFAARPVDTTAVAAGSAGVGRAGAAWVEPGLLLLALALFAPFLAAMAAMPLTGTMLLPGWVQMLLATPIQFGLGLPFYRAAWSALRAGGATMDLLVVIGTTAAWLLSAVVLVAGPAAGGDLYFDASAAVITLVLLGRWLEARARRATVAAVDRLARLQPKTALVVRAPAMVPVETPLDQVRSGDRVMVRPGARVPVDGLILSGHSIFDDSLVTGESLPVDRGPGDLVIGGAINGPGLLTVQATTVGSTSRLSRLIRAVERAQASKPDIQRLVDRVAAWFVPAVVLLAGLTLAGWLLAGAGVATALVHAVTVLVIACPCALGLATPTAVAVGIDVAARHGILIKDAAVLETAARLGSVLFDKTGTLTEGRPAVVAIDPAPGRTVAAVLRPAAVVQRDNDHPLARAICDHAAETNAPATAAATASTPGAHAVVAIPGFGVTGRIAETQAETQAETEIAIGNRALMGRSGFDAAALAALEPRAAAHEDAGRTVVWLARTAPDRAVLGIIALVDRPRAGAAAAITALRRLDVVPVMLTGDHPATAARVAAGLGIDRVVAGVPPERKADTVAGQRAAQGRPVAMVGDGLNDAPALAAADVGIAMAGGTDAARDAATVVVMRDDPAAVADAVWLSRRITAKIRQNLGWAFLYNVLALPLAVAGLIGPAIAGGAMALSSVCVVANALTLHRLAPAARSPEGPPGAGGTAPVRDHRAGAGETT